MNLRQSKDVEIRLSYSALNLMVCERLFELMRLRNPMLLSNDSSNIHTTSGTALHIGIQNLLDGKVLESCWIDMLKEWRFDLWDDKQKKTFPKFSAALEIFQHQWNWDRYQIVDIKGVKPTELSVKINLGNPKHNFYARLDKVFYDPLEDMYGVIEIKTTGSNHLNLEPMWKNSDQGVGNSICLHQIAPDRKSYYVMYIVIQFTGQYDTPRVHIFKFKKSVRDRLEWLQGLGMKYQRIVDAIDKYGLFMKNGDHCSNHYGRTCPLYGTCDNVDPEIWSPEKDSEQEKWDFEFDILSLIDEQLRDL